jgi:A/G-specific adenine glycosylase
MSNRAPGSFSASHRRQFRSKILAWYDAHRRDLPWRRDRDPYRVWLSEIMLQQTRVAAVIEHYRKFLQKFPTIKKLAAAREASVLAAWSGLGYYRRARMLRAAAKAIVGERRGKFPESMEELRKLPGIGRYTSAAIASIAYDEPVAAVDGNIERVLQRLAGRQLGKNEQWKVAEELLDRSRPGDFNQAMIELGATVCTPRTPMCLTCPVSASCGTRGELAASAKRAKQKKREIHYLLDSRDEKVVLMQRSTDVPLMAGMWELPEMTETNGASDPTFGGSSISQPSFTVRHSITTTDYTVRVWRMTAPSSAGGKWVHHKQLARLPLTGLTCKIMRKAEIMPRRSHPLK